MVVLWRVFAGRTSLTLITSIDAAGFTLEGLSTKDFSAPSLTVFSLEAAEGGLDKKT
jgi:hypothetical protein